MREIKFRAWDKVVREMFIFGKPDHCFEYGTLSFEPLQETYRGICQFPDDASFENWELMQYTGLLDKNGKEVYEGDILHWADDYRLVVEWDPDIAGFCRGAIWNVEISEVIGNIHENPELLNASL